MNIKKHIPNAITCGNVVCGSLGLIFCLESGNVQLAALLMFCGAVFDFFDGFAARLLKVSSPMGKELDSLADMVSFGALPAMMMYWMLQQSTDDVYIPYAALLIVAFSALRLAKFNIDERQSDTFIGVPTPANALLIGSLAVIAETYPEYGGYILQLPWLLVLTVVMSLLLVAELPLIAMKFKDYTWENNKFRYLLIGGSGLLLAFFQLLAVPMIVVYYILLSIIQNMVGNSRANQ